MAVTKKDVEAIAGLSRLSFSDKEKDDLTGLLNSILDYFDKLSELDTEHVEPLTHILPVQNVMRDDIVREPLGQESTLKNAPQSDRGHFVIPKVIE